MGRGEVQKQRRQPEPRTEHDPGRQISPPLSLHADQLHQRDRGDVDHEKAPQRTDADQIGAGAAGRADVAQRFAGERLTAQHREHPERTGDQGRDRADQERRVHRPGGEEAGLEHVIDDGHRAAARAASSQLNTSTPAPRSSQSVTACGPDRLIAGPGDDQHAAVHAQHVDVVAVQFGQDVAADDLIGTPVHRPAAGEVDDPVHHRQQRIDLVRGDQDRHPLLAGDPRHQRHDLAGAAQVEVGERLVEQQQLRPADQRVADQHPLLLAAR